MVKKVLKSIRARLSKPAAGREQEERAQPVRQETPRQTTPPPRPVQEVYEPSARKHSKPSEPAREPDAAPKQPQGDGTRKKRRRPRRRKPATARQDSGQGQASPQKETSPWDPTQFNVPPKEGSTRFHDLGLPNEILRAVADLGFEYCTPIQAEILPTTLQGIDASGRAQTGTGKTAAFLITAYTHLLRHPDQETPRKGTPRVLVIAPTRELVIQIEKEARDLSKYTPFKTMPVFGGMDYDKQRRRLVEEIIDVVVATPGRLLDFKRKRDLHLGHVEILVIDEADRMLDMGFIPDVRDIIHSTPPKSQRHTMLFSATLTPEVTRLASQWTRDSVTVEIAPEQVAVDTVDQRVYITTSDDKFALLYNILKEQAGQPVIVFGNRRDLTQKLTDYLQAYDIPCELLSGAVTQAKRVRTLEDFKRGKFQVLVATDVAGRGLHIDGVSHVINYTLPTDPDDYVHRIGRTGRAGAAGTSISFACEEDSFYIPDIEKYMGRALPCTHPDEALLEPPPPLDPAKLKVRREKPAPRRGGGRAGSGRGQRGGGRRPRSGGSSSSRPTSR